MSRQSSGRRDAARTTRGSGRPGPLVLLLTVLTLAAAFAAFSIPGWWPAVVAVAAAVAVVVIAAWRLGAASADAPATVPARTDLIAAVSHDLRTPLATIGAYVELLEAGDGGELSGEQRKMLDVVEENVQRAYAIADDLIELRGADTHSREPVPVAEVLARAVRAMQPNARAHGLTLTLDAHLDDARVAGNPVQLDRVLINLLSNAVKFTPQGGTITVRGRVESGSVRIEVTDTGAGIAPREQQRIFDRYYRADAARAGRVPGSGLGLAIVKEIAAQHGGTVEVRSKPGQGATFSLTLPTLGYGAAVA